LKQVGIFFGSSSGKTAEIAELICEKIGNDRADLRDVRQSSPVEWMDYDILILGVPTWGIGEMQEDWKGFIHLLPELDLTGRKVALFGLGDQESYPGTFADAMGSLYEVLLKTGCRFTGSWPVSGYVFEGSRAVRGDKFVGLVLDVENQPEETEKRIDKWLKDLLKEDGARKSDG
jgi:flavodoxin I